MPSTRKRRTESVADEPARTFPPANIPGLRWNLAPTILPLLRRTWPLLALLTTFCAVLSPSANGQELFTEKADSTPMEVERIYVRGKIGRAHV